MAMITPKPEFQHLAEEEVRAAVADTDANNPIAQEVARLIDGYIANFQATVERSGHVPASILRATPSSPIEAVAMDLTTEAVRAAFAEAAE